MTHTPKKRVPVPKSLTLFVIIYMSLCSLAALNQGNTEFLMYAVMMVVFITVLVYLHRLVGFSRAALWLLTIWGFLHMMGGTVPIPESLAPDGGSPVLYSLRYHPWLPRYDQITHAFGFFGATVASYESARSLLGAPRNIHLAITAGLMGMGLGAINEVLEFAATRVTDTNVGGYVNTGWDLVSNSIGCIAGAIWSNSRRFTDESEPIKNEADG